MELDVCSRGEILCDDDEPGEPLEIGETGSVGVEAYDDEAGCSNDEPRSAV